MMPIPIYIDDPPWHPEDETTGFPQTLWRHAYFHQQKTMIPTNCYKILTINGPIKETPVKNHVTPQGNQSTTGL